MTGKRGFTKKISLRRVGNVPLKSAFGLRKPDIPGQTNAIEIPAAIAVSPSDLSVSTMTNEELLSRAKRSIDSCEKPLREAAEDISRAYEQGATQREIADGVGKSAAWVNRLLKWRSSGYEGTAFGDKIVQGVNKRDLQLTPGSAEPSLADTASLVLGKKGSADSSGRERLVEAVETTGSSDAQEKVDTPPALAPATKMLTAHHAPSDHYIPAPLNRQDPERAFQRLAQEWSSSPFRDLFLDSPKAAQERFVREVLLGKRGTQLINPFLATEANGVNSVSEEPIA